MSGPSEQCTCQPKPTGEAPDAPSLDCPIHGPDQEARGGRCPTCGSRRRERRLTYHVDLVGDLLCDDRWHDPAPEPEARAEGFCRHGIPGGIGCWECEQRPIPEPEGKPEQDRCPKCGSADPTMVRGMERSRCNPCSDPFHEGKPEQGREAERAEVREKLWDEVHRIGGPRKEQLVEIGRELDAFLAVERTRAEQAEAERDEWEAHAKDAEEIWLETDKRLKAAEAKLRDREAQLRQAIEQRDYERKRALGQIQRNRELRAQLWEHVEAMQLWADNAAEQAGRTSGGVSTRAFARYHAYGQAADHARQIIEGGGE